MKKIVLTFIILFSLSTVAQSAKKSTSKKKSTSNTFYTPKEKEDIKNRFLVEIEEIEMSPSVKTKYLEIVNKISEKIRAINKEPNISKEEISTKANKIIKDQNQEIKKILTPDQYKKHKIIYNKYQNSMNYRIQQR